jgi:hypothetical protein
MIVLVVVLTPQKSMLGTGHYSVGVWPFVEGLPYI